MSPPSGLGTLAGGCQEGAVVGDTVEEKTHGLGQGEESKLESESVGAGCLWPGQETGTWIVPPDLWTELLCPAYLTYLQDPPT